MKEILGRCGYRCDLCAARSEDQAVRQKLVDGWRNYFGHQNYTAENVRCDGCLSNGRLADKNCQARPCVMEKGIENCAYCDEFPCDKLKPLLCSREELVERFGEIPEEDYNLCMIQFESLPRLLKIRKALGKE
jgi:hypothetical protein